MKKVFLLVLPVYLVISQAYAFWKKQQKQQTAFSLSLWSRSCYILPAYLYLK